MFQDDKSPRIRQLVGEINTDVTQLREMYDPALDLQNWTPEQKNRVNLYLDGIEYRLWDIVILSKILDKAPLEEMIAP